MDFGSTLSALRRTLLTHELYFMFIRQTDYLVIQSIPRHTTLGERLIVLHVKTYAVQVQRCYAEFSLAVGRLVTTEPAGVTTSSQQ